MISYILSIFFKIIYLIIIVVVLLSWIPIFDTKKEPLVTMLKIYNTIMSPFKAISPPIGMIDISPIVAIIFLQIAEYIIIYRILIPLGLIPLAIITAIKPKTISYKSFETD